MLSAEDIVRLDKALRVTEKEFHDAYERGQGGGEWVPENNAERILQARKILGLVNIVGRATEKEEGDK